MTIDELRARKQELLARKKYELDLQAKGEGDNFALFMVNEELLDVNAQLRAFTPSQRIGKRRTTRSEWAPDKQQFIDWTRKDADEEIDEARSQMYGLLRNGIASISGRQREMLLLWSDGLRVTTIAEQMKVDKSTVSRTLKRAQKNVKRITETRMAVERLRDENRLDVSEPEVAKLLMSALTVHQAVCFYLYYSERMSVREVGQLLRVDHSTIWRTVQRALLRIGDVLGSDVDVLENVEELDNLVFSIYCGLCDQCEDLPPVVQTHIKRVPTEGYINREKIPRKEVHESIRKPKFLIQTNIKAPRGVLRHEQHGRLFRMLQERYRDVRLTWKGNQWLHPIARWLVKIFQTVARPRKSSRKS